MVKLKQSVIIGFIVTAYGLLCLAGSSEVKKLGFYTNVDFSLSEDEASGYQICLWHYRDGMVGILSKTTPGVSRITNWELTNVRYNPKTGAFLFDTDLGIYRAQFSGVLSKELIEGQLTLTLVGNNNNQEISELVLKKCCEDAVANRDFNDYKELKSFWAEY